ncbi:MAG: pseudouridine synthase, partial [Planctomycetaceae bacterium]
MADSPPDETEELLEPDEVASEELAGESLEPGAVGPRLALGEESQAGGRGTPVAPERVTVEARAHGWRLDHYLTRLYPNYSRAQFQREIETGSIVVNGLSAKASRRLHVNDIVQFQLPRQPDRSVVPENLPLEVLFEDAHLVVLNKAANMVVHPGRGHQRGTLVGALQYHFDRLSDVAGADRPGIVHRLDRDTTGIMVVAKDNQV